MNVCKRPENAFANDDLVFLEQIAHQIAIAVENALDYGKATEDRSQTIEQKLYLQEEIQNEHNIGEIIGANSGLRAVLEQVAVGCPCRFERVDPGRDGNRRRTRCTRNP